jgi:GMP synthase-like glutamine amidotransferase
MRGLLIGNARDLDAGFVGGRLRQHGVTFTEAQREHPGDWPALDGIDVVLLLGSEWHVYDPVTAPAVEAEAAVVREAVGRGVPLLGICFGAQVVAHALGGEVVRAAEPEIGWIDVTVDEGGPPIAGGPWMSWHHDVVTPPPGFGVHARNEVGPQLIGGGRVVATQFHPEATETMVRDWLEHGGAADLSARGGDPDALLATTRGNVARSRPAAEALVDWYLEAVVGG